MKLAGIVASILSLTFTALVSSSVSAETMRIWFDGDGFECTVTVDLDSLIVIEPSMGLTQLDGQSVCNHGSSIFYSRALIYVTNNPSSPLVISTDVTEDWYTQYTGFRGQPFTKTLCRFGEVNQCR